MPISRKAQPRSLVHTISEQLALRIRQQEGANAVLPPERRLAEELGVSRSVIREAIKCLELQGLLEVRQGSGSRVVNNLHHPLNGSLALLIPDPKQRLWQLHETRLVLEPEVARRAALRANSDQVEQLRKIQQRLENAEEGGDAIAIDIEFHHALAEASGNLMFRLILDSLGDISRESRERSIGRVGKQSAINHHGMIIEAVAAGEADAAVEAMKFHLSEAWKDMGVDE